MLMLVSYLFTKDLTLALINFQFIRSNIPAATGYAVYVTYFILLFVLSKVMFWTYLLLTKKGTQTKLCCIMSWLTITKYQFLTCEYIVCLICRFCLSLLISTRVLLDLHVAISNMGLFYKKQELIILRLQSEYVCVITSLPKYVHVCYLTITTMHNSFPLFLFY